MRKKQESTGIVCMVLPPGGRWSKAKTEKSSPSSWFSLY